jgi:abhydrolase domain-containing protein 6
MPAITSSSWSTRLSQGLFSSSQRAWEFLARLTEEFVTLPDNSRISFLSHGEGIPLVLIHGFASDRSSWAILYPFLKGYERILIIDLPGWGQSNHQSHLSYKPSDQAHRLEQFRAALGIEKWHLVGISMGAAIAGIYAAHYPQNMYTLTLLNAAGVPAGPGKPAVNDTLLGKNPLVLEARRDIRRLWDAVFYRKPLFSKLFAPALISSYIERQSIQHSLFLDLIRESSILREKVSSICCPTLVIWGRQDALIDVSCVEELRKERPDFLYKILEHCGHLPILERPIKTARLINRWIERSQEFSSSDLA